MKFVASGLFLVLAVGSFACSKVSEDAFKDDLKTSPKPVVKAGPVMTSISQPVPIPYPNVARADVADGGLKSAAPTTTVR